MAPICLQQLDPFLLSSTTPDLNPIEMAFSKLKQLMRSAEHRTVRSLWTDTQRMLDQITADE